jgi:hypothetical protein
MTGRRDQVKHTRFELDERAGVTRQLLHAPDRLPPQPACHDILREDLVARLQIKARHPPTILREGFGFSAQAAR